jgi:hypothetical protein
MDQTLHPKNGGKTDENGGKWWTTNMNTLGQCYNLFHRQDIEGLVNAWQLPHGVGVQRHATLCVCVLELAFVRQLRVPKIDNEDDARLLAVVPHLANSQPPLTATSNFVIVRVIKQDHLALNPWPRLVANSNARTLRHLPNSTPPIKHPHLQP